MLCQLFSTPRLLLSSLPLSLQPLTYLFRSRTPFSMLFLPSPPLLFPRTPVFFLQHIRLLVLAAAVFVLLSNCLRLLLTDRFFLHPYYRLSLPPCGLPLPSKSL
jgi:hypothetical protein